MKAHQLAQLLLNGPDHQVHTDTGRVPVAVETVSWGGVPVVCLTTESCFLEDEEDEEDED